MAHRRDFGARPRCLAVLGVALFAATASCGDPYDDCDEPSADIIERAPSRLSETGLYSDITTRTLGSAVRQFRPHFQLWSDGAKKQRWLFIPPGTRIDTSDMDDWRFPQGTKLWKEFSYGERPVETRLLEKVGSADADWLTISYVWTEDGNDAVAAPQGAVNVLGTPLDVPAARECAACHGGRRSGVLGFSAVQLSPAAGEGLSLNQLSAEGLLTDPPDELFIVPGAETERDALGYLHANCGHCHNQNRPPRRGARCYDPDNGLDLWLRVDQLDRPEDTPAYRSAIGSFVKPGDPDDSRLMKLVSSRTRSRRMPPLATEIVDDEAVRILSAWIRGLEAP